MLALDNNLMRKLRAHQLIIIEAKGLRTDSSGWLPAAASPGGLFLECGQTQTRLEIVLQLYLLAILKPLQFPKGSHAFKIGSGKSNQPFFSF